MKRLAQITVLLTIAALALAASASASFGLEKFDVTYTNADGSPATQAGIHPFTMTTSVYFNKLSPSQPDGEIKDFDAEQIAGLIADPSAVPRCSTVDFLTVIPGVRNSLCPDSTSLGAAASDITLDANASSPIFNLNPPPGVALKIGFVVDNTPVTIEVGLKDRPPYNGSAVVTNLPQTSGILASVLTLWGNPGDPAHDPFRGNCVSSIQPAGTLPLNKASQFPELPSFGNCPTNAPDTPFLTLSRACQGPLVTSYATDSWQHPGSRPPNGEPDLSDPSWISGSVLTHDNSEPPNPLGMTGCSKLGFSPSITAQPTTKAASSPTGLDFGLDVHDEGLTSPSGLANSDIKKAVVTLPEGFSTNPSLAEGLNVCSEADLARETAKSAPGEGCPDASKIGSVEVETPLLEETLKGSLYVAKPYENEFHSLLALYIVIKSEKLGIVVKQAAKVTPNPVTGQLVTTTEEMPQLPFSHFRLHFREGTRSPLASPPGCGVYDGHDPAHEPVRAVLTPWSGGGPIETTSAFTIISGPDNGPCPTGGLPPFKPGLIAGTLNNAAGHFSPFNVRLSRSDSEQEITHFSIKLPPGITGKLAGIPYCPDAAIAQAKARTGSHGGQEELEHPSCPAASEVGHTLAGAGVGPSLAYAPGKLYLAGPYHGSNISLVSITAAKVGPFDLGTVVVRLGFKINPETAEVFIDSTGSDPIPHIIQGIPVHLRDIRAYTDRPNFVLNPTSCTRTSTASTLLGSGLDFASEADDRPITVSTPFQAADCAALPFKPQLGLRLIGKTNRGAHPAFKANLKMNGIGEAGIARAQVTLPHSEFIENAHFKTICTRVQFKEGAGNGADCPAGSLYGHAKAITPILGEALEGPVFLRSSEHQLPDLVVALHNAQLDFDLVGRVDSVKGGGIRNTFETAPDAPVTSFSLELEGGKKGLFVNSTNLCKGVHKAEANFTGQNGKIYDTKPALKVKCGKARKGKGKGKRAAHHRRAG